MRLLVLVPDLRDAQEVHGVPRHEALHRGAHRIWGPFGVARRFRGRDAIAGREAPRGVVVVHERVEGEHEEEHRDAGKRRDAPHGREPGRLRRHRGGERAPRTESRRVVAQTVRARDSTRNSFSRSTSDVVSRARRRRACFTLAAWIAPHSRAHGGRAAPSHDGVRRRWGPVLLRRSAGARSADAASRRAPPTTERGPASSEFHARSAASPARIGGRSRPTRRRRDAIARSTRARRPASRVSDLTKSSHAALSSASPSPRVVSPRPRRASCRVRTSGT